jgi:competence protein ComEA
MKLHAFRAAALVLVTALAATSSAAAADTIPAADGGQKVNINQASAAQLAMLPRVGAKAAERIVEYRKAHGPFSQPEQLMEVKGFGEKRFTELKPYVTVSGATTLASKVSSRGTRGGSTGKKASSRNASTSVSTGKGR